MNRSEFTDRQEIRRTLSYYVYRPHTYNLQTDMFLLSIQKTENFPKNTCVAYRQPLGPWGLDGDAQ